MIFNFSSQKKVFVIGILKKIFEKKHSNKHSVVFRPFLDILSLNVKKELKKLTQHVLTSAPHFFSDQNLTQIIFNNRDNELVHSKHKMTSACKNIRKISNHLYI